MLQQLGSISFVSAHSGFSDLQSSSIIKGKNYYMAKSIDNHPELIQQLFQTNTLSKTPNIFQDPVNLKIIQHDPQIGPKYQNNKILTRSIVGKPEIFKKKQQPIQHQDFMMPTSQAANLSESSVIKKESPLQRRLTLMKIAQSPIKLSKPSKNEKTITGSELQNKINYLEKRLISIQLDEKKAYSSLPFHEKQLQFKEQRALENFDEKERLQAQILHSLSARLSRNPNQSLMIDLYKFRRKVEYSSTNEKMRQISEYNGSKIIELQENNQVPFFLSSERQEIIRKPSILSKDLEIRDVLKKKNEEKAFSTSSLYDYLDQQEKKYKPLVRAKISSNLEELIVQGQSKYDQEISINPNQKYIIRDVDQQKVDENDYL